MSTDFSLDALLNGSTSNTSVTSPSISKPSSTSTPTSSATSPQATQFCSTSLPTPPHEQEAIVTTKKRSSKRKRDDEEEEQHKQEKPKKKRVRTAYTRQQLQHLEFAFAQNPYPDMLMRENIAEELGLPDQKIHVWFQNRRAKLRRLRGQPTAAATFQTPVIGTSLIPCAPPSPFSVSQTVGTGVTPTTLYHLHQPPKRQTNQSVAVQTRSSPSLVSPSPSPSPLPFGVQTASRSWSTTPSVSPQSSPSISPTQMHSFTSPPPGSTLPAYSFVLPSTRTSSVAGPDGHRVTFAQPFPSPFPYYYPPRNSPKAPMYFLDMTPPLSGNSINSIVPPFPQFYHS